MLLQNAIAHFLRFPTNKMLQFCTNWKVIIVHSYKKLSVTTREVTQLSNAQVNAVTYNLDQLVARGR